mmetsp:Transcript_126980/g.353665  ORF Transcript_126980/g.353665 Transcript_126980/m.353665 type:complete len:214 (-) Transcript_126980:361-1002(-)
MGAAPQPRPALPSRWRALATSCGCRPPHAQPPRHQPAPQQQQSAHSPPQDSRARSTKGSGSPPGRRALWSPRSSAPHPGRFPPRCQCHLCAQQTPCKPVGRWRPRPAPRPASQQQPPSAGPVPCQSGGTRGQSSRAWCRGPAPPWSRQTHGGGGHNGASCSRTRHRRRPRRHSPPALVGPGFEPPLLPRRPAASSAELLRRLHRSGRFHHVCL